MNYLIPFLILILIVVFIHEYGHYYFAKKYGVGITDFSIGFGKEIFGWNDKSGTRWKICWIPLGGYVKFFGDRNVFSQSEQKEIINKYSEEEKKKIIYIKAYIPKIYYCCSRTVGKFCFSNTNFFLNKHVCGKRYDPGYN